MLVALQRVVLYLVDVDAVTFGVGQVETVIAIIVTATLYGFRQLFKDV